MANEPIRGSTLMAGVKLAPNSNGDPITCVVKVNDTLDQPALLVDIADRSLRSDRKSVV